jgi:hypothetical protein
MPTYEKHVRATAYGTLAGPEIFSFGISLGRNFGAPALSDALEPNNAVWQDMADDFQTFWQAIAIHNSAKLMGVKFAPIGTDGKYSGPSIERTLGGTTGIAGVTSTPRHANQVALAVTMHAVEDLGRVKGRFYLPVPGYAVGTDGRISEADRDSVETAAKQFLDNINNQPGLDVLDMRTVIASAGRKNPDGSEKFSPRNFEVTSVSVGRTLDTIRRRRNKLTEYRGAATSLASGN